MTNSIEIYRAGIDEAGRGPLIGPMFMASCIFPDNFDHDKILLQDSKQFGSSTRAKILRGEITKQLFSHCICKVVEISSSVIDNRVKYGNGLNRLEQDIARFLLSYIPGNLKVMADGINLFKPLCNQFTNLSAENRADANHKSVAAASIIAKHFRDQWFDNYKKRIFDSTGIIVSGGGYVNKNTSKFIEEFLNKQNRKPPCIRKSWKLKPKNLTFF